MKSFNPELILMIALPIMVLLAGAYTASLAMREGFTPIAIASTQAAPVR